MKKTYVMGIVNVTPVLLDVDAAVQQGATNGKDGADSSISAERVLTRLDAVSLEVSSPASSPSLQASQRK